MHLCRQLSNSWKRGGRHSCSAWAEIVIKPQCHQAAACHELCSAPAPWGPQGPPCASTLFSVCLSPCALLLGPDSLSFTLQMVQVVLKYWPDNRKWARRNRWTKMKWSNKSECKCSGWYRGGGSRLWWTLGVKSSLSSLCLSRHQLLFSIMQKEVKMSFTVSLSIYLFTDLTWLHSDSRERVKTWAAGGKDVTHAEIKVSQ